MSCYKFWCCNSEVPVDQVGNGTFTKISDSGGKNKTIVVQGPRKKSQDLSNRKNTFTIENKIPDENTSKVEFKDPIDGVLTVNHKPDTIISTNESNNVNHTFTGMIPTKSENDEINIVNINQSDENDTKSKRKGMMSDKIDTKKEKALNIEYFDKDESSKELIKKAIRENDFLNNVMNETRLDLVTRAMKPEFYEADSNIITEGDTGSFLFVSEEGDFEVRKGNQFMKRFGSGVVFGELAILYKAKRFASIITLSKAKVWSLERKTFQKIMIHTERLENVENINFLKNVTLFESLSEELLQQIADLLKREFYATGARIINEGDDGDKFYIIRGGTVTVSKRDAFGNERGISQLKREEYFGEQALIHNDKRLASVFANPPGTECLTLDRTSFERYLGPLEVIKNHPTPPKPTCIDDIEILSPFKSVINERCKDIKLKDLEQIGTLGTGAFGRVELVEYKPFKETFALKYLKKIDIVEQQQTDHVFSEKDIMASCQSDFIIKLYNTYRDNKYIYFLMEPCLGGDVWTLLQKHKHFDEKVSRFMAACVVEAFDYLHSKTMIYRDLKPENLMLDNRGYIKVVDFGFAKRLQPPNKTYTFVGTPEYTAPEIILCKGHDRSADYWTLGIFIHELLTGRPIFRGKDQMKTFNLILRGIDVVDLSDKVPKKAQHLIKKLCRQTASERLGCQLNGIMDIKKHPWFVGFDWEKLKSQKMTAPLIVPVRNNKDLSNFGNFPPDKDDPPDEFSGWDMMF